MTLDRRILVVPALVLLLASCGQSTAPPTSPAPTSATATSSPSASPSATPAALDVPSLVGNWTVTGESAEPGTIVTIDTNEMRVWSSCGMTYAPWRADSSGLFVASIDAWSGGCGAQQLRPAWVVDAVGWTTDGADVVLLADDGSALARLAPGGTPTPGPDVLPSMASPPTVSPDEQMRLAAEPELPAGLRPATRAEIVGSWVAEGFEDGGGGAPKPPGAVFGDDGAWVGSDGCNSGRGRWVADDEGRMLATTGPTTLIGCTGAPVPQWLASTRLAGFDGDVLVLVDAQGVEIGRLVPATA